MENPFIYTGTVEGESFCNREKELRDLMSFSKTGQNVLIYSHRRFGKTSLIKKLIKELSVHSPAIKTCYIDLYGTLTEKDFIEAIFKSFSQVESSMDKFANIIKGLFKNVRAKISIDPESGKIDVTPSYDPNDRALVFDEVIDFLANYSKKSKSVVIFDEFQEITSYNEKTLEKRFRKIIQHHNNICYIFMGSQRHILEQMFSESGRALYRLVEPYPLKRIDSIHYLSWIKGLYKKYKGKHPPTKFIEEIIKICENHPLYIQQFFYFLWQEAEISFEKIKELGDQILDRRYNEYANIWDNLSLNQKKTCVLLINSNGKNIYQLNSIQEAGLKSPSQVKMAVTYLQKHDIIYKNHGFHFSDVMFKKWLNRMLSK